MMSMEASMTDWREMHSDFIPMLHWHAKMVDIDDGRVAGMEPIAPPDGVVPAGATRGESLEWGIKIENLPRLLMVYDLYLTRKDGRLCGYFNEKGNGFEKDWLR